MTAPRPQNWARRTLVPAGGVAFWLLLCAALRAGAQLTVLPDPEPKQIFPGKQQLDVLIRNPGTDAADAAVRLRLVQATSATAVRLGEVFWKNIRVLPGQTIRDSAGLEFPAVNAETRFLVQWLADTNILIGQTEVRVYPTNLLTELKALAGESPPGLYDPENLLKSLLRQLTIEFDDLEISGLENFPGTLAIIGPFASPARMPEWLVNGIAPLAKKGKAVVWIQPAPGRRDVPQPSFYVVPQNHTGVVVVQPEPVARLAENPRSQLNLIYFCKLALHPRPPALPDLTSKP